MRWISIAAGPGVAPGGPKRRAGLRAICGKHKTSEWDLDRAFLTGTCSIVVRRPNTPRRRHRRGVTGLPCPSPPNLNLSPSSPPSFLPVQVPTAWPSPHAASISCSSSCNRLPRLYPSAPSFLRPFPPSSFFGSFRRHVLCTPPLPLAPSPSRGFRSPSRRPSCRLAAIRSKPCPPSSTRTRPPSTKHP